jgi:LuxR family transcriptional regulator, maltose regulon positive regulatory protein
VLLDQDRYRFNRALDYEYDVESFGAKLEQARAATPPDERAAAFGAAVDLYKGPYLPDMDGIWIYSERERLWQGCVEATLGLAGRRLETGAYGSALELCQRLLVQDPCLEEAHRVLMRAHAALGNRAGMTRQFERCRQALAEEANAPLSAETQMLFDRLTQR